MHQALLFESNAECEHRYVELCHSKFQIALFDSTQCQQPADAVDSTLQDKPYRVLACTYIPTGVARKQ